MTDAQKPLPIHARIAWHLQLASRGVRCSTEAPGATLERSAAHSAEAARLRQLYSNLSATTLQAGERHPKRDDNVSGYPTSMPDFANALYYGDNLEVMRRYVADESVDLVYLDPPFNSERDYNVLFEERDGSKSSAQIQAFGDTWRWDAEAARAYDDVVLRGDRVSDVMIAFRTFLGETDMLAYLSMMAPRLVELHRGLKSTGSLYLHCDPTASHYLKLLLDAVFGTRNFRSEIVWKRSSAHSDAKQGRKIHGHIHDTILFYTKSDAWTWTTVYTPYDQEYIDNFYMHVDEASGRRFQLGDLTAAKPGGDVSYDFHGTKPYDGRYWAYSREHMEQFLAEDRLYFPKNGGTPRYKRYLDEMPGVPLQDVWTDIKPISGQAAERLGYPTQKPVALLQRIVACSSKEGDVVLDPFCGCGTTIDAAISSRRKWIGIDVTHLAITLIKNRIKDSYGSGFEYNVVGEPTSITGAEELAKTDKYQFQWWALGLVGARPVEQKKGADRGIDGRLLFHDSTAKGAVHQAIFSVKAGALKAGELRDLVGTVSREKAQIGVLISFAKPTRQMRAEAASHGFYESAWGKHQKIQLITVDELLAGHSLDLPRTSGANVTYKSAPKARTVRGVRETPRQGYIQATSDQHDLL
jgi:DNA modification methylase